MKREQLYFTSPPVKYLQGVTVWSTKPWRHAAGTHWELPSFWASILDGVRWSLHSLTALPREKKRRWSATRTLGGFQWRSGRFGKDKELLLSSRNEPWFLNSHSVVCHYTHWATEVPATLDDNNNYYYHYYYCCYYYHHHYTLFLWPSHTHIHKYVDALSASISNVIWKPIHCAPLATVIYAFWLI